MSQEFQIVSNSLHSHFDILMELFSAVKDFCISLPSRKKEFGVGFYKCHMDWDM